MARLDNDTRSFFEKIANAAPGGQKDEASSSNPTREALSVARTIVKATKAPGDTVTKSIIRQAASELMKIAAVSPIRVYEVLTEHYGKEWYDWEPETIWQTLSKDHALEATDELKNIVLAFQTAVTTNAPFEHWHVFEKFVHAISGNHVDFLLVQPAELDDIALAVKVLHDLRPKEEFDDEVLGYIAACAKHAGVVYLPTVLFPAGAQDKLALMGNDGHLLAQIRAVENADPAKISDEALKIQLQKLREIRERVANA